MICEFCNNEPKWKFSTRQPGLGSYEKLTCNKHVMETRRLIAVDLAGLHPIPSYALERITSDT